MEENWKIIKFKYHQWKNLPTWTKDRERKPEIDGERRDLLKEELGQNKVLCSSLTESNRQWSTPIQALRRFPCQRDRSPATCWLLALENRTNLDSSLSPYHWVNPLARLVGCPCFCFVGSWIVGLAMGKAEFKSADVTIGFSK